MNEVLPTTGFCNDPRAGALDVGIIWIDANAAFTAANPAAMHLLGATDRHGMDAAWSRLCKAMVGESGDIDQTGLAACPGADIDVVVGDQTRQVRARVHQPALGAWPGFLVTLSELRMNDASEEELLAAAQHRSLLRTQAAAAHDLKGILNALSLSAQVQIRLLAGIKTSEPDALAQCAKYSTTMSDQVGRMASLVQDVFRGSVEAPRGSEDLDLGDCLGDAAARVGPLAARQSVSLRVEPMRIPVWVHVRRDLLLQAMVSLAIDAIDATGPGGSVRVAAKLVDGEARIQVIAGAPGTSGDGHAPTEPGTGTGLELVEMVARNHGGSVRTWTGTERGRTVELVLPPVQTS